MNNIEIMGIRVFISGNSGNKEVSFFNCTYLLRSILVNLTLKFLRGKLICGHFFQVLLNEILTKYVVGKTIFMSKNFSIARIIVTRR